MRKLVTLSLFCLFVFCGLTQELAAQTEAKVSKPDTIRSKSGYKSGFKLGGVGNKEALMEKDDYLAPYYRWDLTFSTHWFDWKRKVNDKTGIQLSVNYSSMFIGSTHTVSDESQNSSASGIFDLTLKVNVINRKKDKNKGSLVFWMDSRHLYYGDVAPAFFFQEAGTATMPALLFSKWKFHTLEFYYSQALFNNRAGLVVGKIDLGDWFQYHALAHPLLHFSDLAFSVSPTVSWSNPGFGIAAGGWLNKAKTLSLTAGINHVAGVNTADPAFFDLGIPQWKDGNFLKMVEFAHTSSRASYYQNRISFTYWHADELPASDDSYFTSPSSTGFSVQGSWVFQDKFVPAFSFGLSDGKGANSLSKVNVSLMNGWHFLSNDLIGVGLNYTKSTITNENQYMTEIFYRFTWSKTTALTPVIKAVVNPALNPNTDFLMYYGVRARISM